MKYIGATGDLEAYFTELDSIFETADAETDKEGTDLSDDLNNAETVDDEKTAYDRYLNRVILTFQDALDELDNLDPPMEAESDHQDFADTIGDAQNLSFEFKQDVADAITSEELQVLVDKFSADIDPITASADDACFALQDTADANSIAVDLNCED